MALLQACQGCDFYNANNPMYYCDNIIYWPVAEDIQNNAFNLSKIAYANYYNLSTRYTQGGPNSPSLTCLATAQEFYCAVAYPYCLDDVLDPHRSVCTNLCNIWKTNCPNEPYDIFCNNSVSTFCSFSVSLVASMIIALVM